MDIYDLFFGVGPATRILFQIGFHPQDDDFKELTPEQYVKYYSEGGTSKERVYALLPRDPHKCAEVAAEEVMVFTESDRAFLELGWDTIESYCSKSGRSFNSDEEKMIYAASLLPDVFTKGSRFEIYHNLKMAVIKGKNDHSSETNE